MHLLYINHFSHSPPTSLPRLTIQLHICPVNTCSGIRTTFRQKKKLPSVQVIAKCSLVTAFNS